MNNDCRPLTRIIGIGNELRGDDAAGRIVARILKQHGDCRIEAIEHDGEAGSLMDLWQDCSCAIIVDATCSGKPVGTVLSFDCHEQDAPIQFSRASTHSFGVGEAIAMARTLNRLPRRLIVYGIEGRDFQPGSTLSGEVRVAIRRVVWRILRDTEHLNVDVKLVEQ